MLSTIIYSARVYHPYAYIHTISYIHLVVRTIIYIISMHGALENSG